MPKYPNKDWSHKKDGPKMQNGKLCPTRLLFFPKIMPLCRFKGMEIIIHKRGLWLMAGLRAQCDSLNVKLAGRIAAAGALCFPSLISWLGNHISKSSRRVRHVTFVTSTRNSIAN
jgi:hypothetical protein